MSEEFIIELCTKLSPLLGVIVGGLITYFTMNKIEQKRWQQEKQEKLSTLKREALSKALEWIEPLRNAEIKASGLLMSVIRGDIDVDDYFDKICQVRHDLFDELKPIELPASQRAVIGSAFYKLRNTILLSFDEIRIIGVKYGHDVRHHKKPLMGFDKCNALLETLTNNITNLENNLQEELYQAYV